jgi:hypothetical protein
VLLARASGPTGTGDDGQPHPITFPVRFHVVAPDAPGNYTWQAAWYGNTGDGGSTHGENRVNVVIHVLQPDPADVPAPLSFLVSSWGKLKNLFK